MTTTNFSFDVINNLSPNDAKEYIKKYFVPLTDGGHAILKNGVYDIVEDKVISKVYFQRLNTELNKYYFKEYTKLRTITYELNKPQLFDDKLNRCPQLKHTYKEYNTFDEKTKEGVQLILNMLKEIWASGDEEIYKYILKWVANMVRGNKNDSCLYLKSIEGVGKSTFTTFLMQYVIGMALCEESGSEPIKSQFNGILAGKLLIIFEELETFSANDWSAVSTRLKRMITSNVMQYQDKNQRAFSSNNINNYILCSNNDAIKDDNGRRYFIVPLSTHRVCDTIYFGNIKNKCYNDEVGHAFFSYLYEIDLNGYYSQKFPETKNKLDSYVKRIDSAYLFLKTEYIFKNIPIYIKRKDFYQEYLAYCTTEGINKKHGVIDFNNKLKEVGIKPYKSSGDIKYKVSHNDLLDLASKNHWIHELDEYKKPSTEETSDKHNEINDTKEILKDKKMDNLLLELEQLKKENEELRKQLNIDTKRPNTYGSKTKKVIEKVDDTKHYEIPDDVEFDDDLVPDLNEFEDAIQSIEIIPKLCSYL